jgi:hypothetical protein
MCWSISGPPACWLLLLSLLLLLLLLLLLGPITPAGAVQDKDRNSLNVLMGVLASLGVQASEAGTQ